MPSNVRPLLIPIALSLSLAGLGGYLVYLLFKHENDFSKASSANYQEKVIKIPKGIVPTVIGRGGLKLKELQNNTGASINFDDNVSNEQFRTCIVKGNPDSVRRAEAQIEDLITSVPLMETGEMWVPQSAVGRIIGRCGENIMSISRDSNAKIKVEDSKQGNDSAQQRRITIKGTPEQIAVAKSLIETKVQEDEELRKNLSQRAPRGKAKSTLMDIGASGDAAGSTEIPLRKEKLVSDGQIDDQIEVYVSAIEDPSKFWVQIVGPKATQLDQLVEKMTEYYSKEENASLHRLTKISVGEIVAAVFNYDNKWYRAEIVDIKAEDPDDQVVELYFLDYGDSECVKKDEVYELSTEFLQLRFQAIECFLAKVEPVGGTWTDKATDEFETLTRVAQWKKLWTKVVCFRNRTEEERKGRSRRAGSPVPGVDLYDNSENRDINVAKELVKSGHAVYKTNTDATVKPRSERAVSESSNFDKSASSSTPKKAQTVNARFSTSPKSRDDSISNSPSNSIDDSRSSDVTADSNASQETSYYRSFNKSPIPGASNADNVNLSYNASSTSNKMLSPNGNEAAKYLENVKDIDTSENGNVSNGVFNTGAIEKTKPGRADNLLETEKMSSTGAIKKTHKEVDKFLGAEKSAADEFNM